MATNRETYRWHDQLYAHSCQGGPRGGAFLSLCRIHERLAFDDIMHYIIDLGTGEYALIRVHHSVESFIEIVNRENRVSDLMRLYVEPYGDGESFHSFSGPVVNYDEYL